MRSHRCQWSRDGVLSSDRTAHKLRKVPDDHLDLEARLFFPLVVEPVLGLST